MFRAEVKSLLAARKKKIILNLAKGRYIDIAGLGTLVARFHSACSQDAILTMAHLGSKFKEVMQITGLLTVFDTYHSEAEPLKASASESRG